MSSSNPMSIEGKFRQDPDIYICPGCAIGMLHEVRIPGKLFDLIIRDCKVCFYTDKRKIENKEART